MKIINRLADRFSKVEPLPVGLHHLQATQDERPYRIHLRLQKDGSGILIVNASTILQLNPTAAEYAFHFVKGATSEEAAKQISARYRINKGMALEDYVEGDFIFHFTTVTEPTTGRKPEPPVPAVSAPPPTRPARVEAAESTLPPTSPPPLDTVPPVSPVAPDRIRPSLSSVQVAEPETSFSQGPLAVDISEVSGDQGVEICVEGSKDYVAGEQVDLQLYVQSKQGRMRLENVQVVIKLIGTTFSPRLYAGKTDRFGCLRMNFSLPTFSGGSAALIVQVSTSIGNDEVKYLVRRRR